MALKPFLNIGISDQMCGVSFGLLWVVTWSAPGVVLVGGYSCMFCNVLPSKNIQT